MEVFYFLIVFIVVCFCILIDRLFRSRNKSNDGMDIPGPKQWPLLGNMFDVDLDRLHISLSKMAETYGPIFRIKILGQNTVIINDAPLERLAFGSTKYGEFFNDRQNYFLGKYIYFDCSDIGFANLNKKQMTLRKMLQRSLKLYGDGISHFNRMNEDELVRVLEELKLTKQCDFDMHAIVSNSLTNTLGLLLTGTCPSCHDSEVIKEYCNLEGVFLSGIGLVYDLIPMIRLLPGFFRNTYRMALAARDQLLTRFYFPVRDSAVRDSADNISEGEPGLVENLIKLKKEINQKAGTEYITENDIKGIIVDIIAAAHETMRTTLANTFAILLTHPHVAKKIQEEIDQRVGSSRMPNDSDKEHMHYTMATIYEVLRYTSPAGLSIPHRASKDQNFEGYFVPKDSVLIPNHWYMHHDPKLWDEPWEFKPERFLDDSEKLLPAESKERRNVLAFSTGRRECPGEDFGKSRIFFYLTAVLQSFDIVPPLDGQLPDTDPRNYDLHGVFVRVKPHLCRVIPRLVC